MCPFKFYIHILSHNCICTLKIVYAPLQIHTFRLTRFLLFWRIIIMITMRLMILESVWQWWPPSSFTFILTVYHLIILLFDDDDFNHMMMMMMMMMKKIMITMIHWWWWWWWSWSQYGSGDRLPLHNNSCWSSHVVISWLRLWWWQ